MNVTSNLSNFERILPGFVDAIRCGGGVRPEVGAGSDIAIRRHVPEELTLDGTPRHTRLLTEEGWGVGCRLAGKIKQVR